MSATAPMDVSAALEHCAEVTRRRARNFYYGLRLLPASERSALYAVYAWMRRADDLADDATDPAAALADLDELRSLTQSAFEGRAGEDPVLVALADTVQRFTISPAHFERMIDGQVADLEGRAYETFTDLERYCELVASTVGGVCVEVWGATGAEAAELARRRGVALQLTNILRDFREDLDRGRVYLPAEDFRRHGIDPAQLARFEPPAACRALLAAAIERADSYYRDSAALDELIRPSCRPTLWAMTRIYHELLERMRRDPRRIALGPRVRLGPVRKGAIALQARMRQTAGVGGR